jgi:hypothetical protein
MTRQLYLQPEPPPVREKRLAGHADPPPANSLWRYRVDQHLDDLGLGPESIARAASDAPPRGCSPSRALPWSSATSTSTATKPSG